MRELGLPPSATYELYLSRAAKGTYVPSAREGSRGRKLRSALRAYRNRVLAKECDAPLGDERDLHTIENVWSDNKMALPDVSRLHIDESREGRPVVCYVQKHSPLTTEEIRTRLQEWGAEVPDSVNFELETIEPLLSPLELLSVGGRDPYVGTGTCISLDGQRCVLTCAHVIKTAEDVGQSGEVAL